MAFDAFFLSAVLKESEEALLGARVEKIHQPGRDTVLLHLKGPMGRQKLLMVLNPTAPRLHLTQSSPENPAEPPMFCMLLRKHLSGARLQKIRQIPMERCVVFQFDCLDELSDPVTKCLVAEMMGRTCNLYLLGPDGRIIDCLRRVGLDETAHRPALPGMYYQEPAAVAKKDPRQADFKAILDAPGADVLAERLMDELGGLSPLVCREAALEAAADVDARVSECEKEQVSQKLTAFFDACLQDPQPWYTLSAGKGRQFAFCPVRQYGPCEKEASFGALMDRFYVASQQKDAMRQRAQGVRKLVQNLLSRLKRKMALQEKELSATFDRETLRQTGDLLMANLYRMQKGQKSVTVSNFYHPEGNDVTIKLWEELSPQQNAARYYKEYNRMKNAEKELTRQLEKGAQEQMYLQSVLEELDRADSEAALEEIRQELVGGGYMKNPGQKGRKKAGKLPPLSFVSTQGYPIYVGRNNRQNEELTFKQARKDDLWLHAQKVHGSHVIIACGGATPPDDTLTQAAQLAAYYSEASGGQNVPVDVLPVRGVKKTPAGKPGMVIYHTYRTVVVNPYPDVVEDPLNKERKE